MERSILIAAAGGVGLALCLFLIRQPPPATALVSPGPNPMAQVEDNEVQGDQPPGSISDPTAGWVTVHEPKADWNVSDSDLIHFICPRPEWYPYHTFRGPPVPESTAGIDPAGYVLRTAQGVRLHRDGWIVTADGRAYQADESTDPI